MKENTGLDTETHKGYVKLICDDSGRFKEIDDFDSILMFLTHSRYEKKFNWFFNIKFDFESMIKYLDYSDLLQLYNEHNLEYKKFELRFISGKFFSILDKNNHHYYFYDMHNFLDTSLNEASKKYLNDQKTEGMDGNKLNTDLGYWKENHDKIIEYCIHDAYLTKKLADYFWQIVYANLKYHPKYPFSKGKLSEEYFLQHCDIPTINNINEKVLETGYSAFKGGRFELLQRGFFDKTFVYDIKSAYPAEIQNLVDYTKGVWKKTDKLNPDSYSGFYNCSVQGMEPFFSPFMLKASTLNVYPNGRFMQTFAKREILFIEEHFPNCEIKIKSGFEFYPEMLVYPFKSEINRLYRWKEKEKDADIKLVIKIILNALYGKTIQIAGGATGKLFNPLWASEITAGARLKLFELGLQKPDSVIMFSTDGVHATEKLKVPKNPELGEFAFEFEGSGVYIMSDTYHLWNDAQKQKYKMRGFSLTIDKDTKNKNNEIMLKEILQSMKNKTKYKYYTFRPYHLGECLIHTKTKKVEDLNIFYQVEKTIDINGDTKRLWERDFRNGIDVLENNIQSLPMVKL